MAFYTIRINLSAAIFPMIVANDGRAIISAGFDQNYVSIITAVTTRDKGIPQVIYCQDVLPTKEGYKSVSYEAVVAAAPSLTTTAGKTFSLTVAPGYTILFCPCSNGENLILDKMAYGPSAVWNNNSAFAPGTVTSVNYVSVAEVQGITYIYYANYGCFKYNTSTFLLEAVTLTSLTASAILAICSSNGYLIAVSVDAIAWSSAETPTDFTPSLVTGAGGGLIEDLVGSIITVAKISGGFVIYGTQNMIGATITNNSSYPFTLAAIPGSGGLNNTLIANEQIAADDNLGFHMAWTIQGLMQVTLNSAKLIIPEFTDFIASNLLEDFNYSTNIFTITELSQALSVKLAIVSERYVVMSYGTSPTALIYAIVYDSLLLRIGKLKVSHTACFEYVNEDSNDPEEYNIDYQMAFITNTAGISIVNSTLNETNDNGVLMIGKFQFQRNLLLVHLSTEIELATTANPAPSSDAIDLLLWPSMDGKQFLTPVNVNPIQTNASLIFTFLAKVVGKNITLMLKGAFEVETIILKFTTAGFR